MDYIKFFSFIIISIYLVQDISGQGFLECYDCSHYELLNYDGRYNYTLSDPVVPILQRMADFSCRRAGSRTTSDQNNYNNQNTNQNFNQNNNMNTNTNYNNNYNNNYKPRTKICDPPPLGSRTRKSMCVTYEGVLYTRISNSRYVIKTITMDCKDLDNTVQPECDVHSGKDDDKFYFEKKLYGKFQDHLQVQNYEGELCTCTNKECQLYSDGRHNVYSIVLVPASILVPVLFHRF